MRKVFVTNYNKMFDYERAKEFGELVFMTQGMILPREYDNIATTFENYAKLAHDDDILLLSGPNLICAVATTTWLRFHPVVELMQHGKVKDENGALIPSYITYRVNA